MDSPSTDLNERFVISRKQEEKWAADHSRITKILGYCMIGIFVFQIASAIFTDRLNLDILMLIGGCAILKGSQAWIRFYLFISCIACISLSRQIASAYWNREPLIAVRKWVDHRDLEFWHEYALPAGIYLGFALLCWSVLQSRRLVYWTTVCKRWAIGFAGATLLFASIAGISSLMRKGEQAAKLRRCMSGIELVREHARSHGYSFSEPNMSLTKKALAEDTTIRIARIHMSPSGSTTLYDCNEQGSAQYNPDYEEFIKGPSGKWLKISIEYTDL